MLGGALLLSFTSGPAGAEVGAPSVTDIANDANFVNGQQIRRGIEVDTGEASYDPADIRAITFETTYEAVPVGWDGIDYRATGLNVHYRTTATPGSDGPTILYRLEVSVDGCLSYLQTFLRGPRSLPDDPPDRYVQWVQLRPNCPDGEGTWILPGYWTATVDPSAKELVMSFPYYALNSKELAKMDEGSVLFGAEANTRTSFWAVPESGFTGPGIDESPIGEEFVIGSDMPEDIPCTTGCQ